MPSLLLWVRRFLSVLVIAFFLAQAAQAAALCLSNQSAALLEFKGGLALPQPDPLGSWRNGTDCCSWYGVNCSSSTGFVISLQLSAVTASLPPARVRPQFSNFTDSLFGLRRLRFLDLSYNQFNGPIPSRLAELTELTHLNFSNAGFSGQVPQEISQMTWLTSLDLSVSYLSSPSLKLEKPSFVDLLKNLGNLRDLRLDGINISMSFADCSSVIASYLPNLRNLSLSSCLISGPMNESILGMRNLAHLDLSRNNMSNVPTLFTNLTSLYYLGLSSCSILGNFPAEIFRLPLLRHLDISNNPNLQGSFPKILPVGSSLVTLSLSSTNLSGNIPDSIGNLNELRILKMSSCNFTGVIPSSISNLTRLQILDMSFNGFNGPLPLLSASTITDIDLSMNRLSGHIPDSFSELQRLTALKLNNNLLTGLIPPRLLNLPSLKTVDLSNNNLTGVLSQFSNPPSLLETLDLSNNSLSGSIPPSISSLSQLKVISLSLNKLSGTVNISLFMGMKNLSKLDLSENRLTVADGHHHPQDTVARLTTLQLSSCNIRSFPESIRNQSNLTILDLSNNNIRGQVPYWLWGVRNLQHLNLSHNMLNDLEKPMNMDNSSSLVVLDLHSNWLGPDLPPFPPNAIFLDFSSNRFRTSIPSSINSPFLLYLSMSNNRINGTIPNSLCNSAIINVLDLSNNDLVGSLPYCLTRLSELSILNLRKNQLTGTIPGWSNGTCSLRTLNLKSNLISGELPRWLGNCNSLEVLDLSNNNFSGEFPTDLGSLNSLRVLALRSNQLSGKVVAPKSKKAKTFPLLQIIDISCNNFSGTLDPQFFELLTAMTKKSRNGTTNLLGLQFLSNVYYKDTVAVTIKGVDFQMIKIMNILTCIDLSNNHFSGEIPEEIGKLAGLLILNMSRNSISGSIPNSMGSLLQLESLDLSNNSLSGNIPQELAHLTFLSVLNLSFNDLQGNIPEANQFSTFGANSFMGNPWLCGRQINKSCTNGSGTDGPVGIANKGVKVEYKVEYIAPGLGFGAGMAMFAIPVLFMKELRKWYFGHVDRLIVALLFVPVRWFCRKVKDVGAVEDNDFGDNDEDDNEHGEKVENMSDSNRHFCVFCTKLGDGATRPVHTECSCLANESILLHPP